MNPDVWWVNEYVQPRLGQDGTLAALEGIGRTITDGRDKLNATTIGKLHPPTYAFVENGLSAWPIELQGKQGEHPEFRTVYMVGNNPRSDISCANSYKSPWGTERG